MGIGKALALAVYGVSLAAGLSPLAQAQQTFDDGLYFQREAVPPFEQTDRVESIAALTLRVPLGHRSSRKDRAEPSVGLNLGLTRRSSWDDPNRSQVYGNLMEFGFSLKGEAYTSFAGEPLNAYHSGE